MIYTPLTFSRNTIAVYAVVLGTAFYERRILNISMTSLGEVIQHTDTDTCFEIPNVLPRDLILRSGTSTNPSKRTEIMARVEVVKRMREIEKEIMKAYNTIGRQSRSLYPLVKARDPNEWGSVSIAEAVKLLAHYRPDHYTTLLAVHKHLMGRPHEFVADFTSHRTAQAFAVRPQSHVNKLNRVTDLLHREDPILMDFVTKARGVIESSRRRALESWHELPTRIDAGVVHYTTDELVIIDVLRQAFRRKRSTQVDPYQTVVSNIIKKFDCYDEVVDDSLLRQVLVDLGEFTPWEDNASRRRELGLDLLPEDKSPTAIARNELVKNSLSSLSSVSQKSSGGSLGPHDFYSHDSLAHIRHDFGDLPVYVVDDMGAEELDDGVSVEKIPSEPGSAWVHVHIADPTSILPPTHALSEQARRLGFTSYFIHRTWPMLPRSLMYEKLSLGTVSKTGQPEPVMTFSFKVDKEGDITDWTVKAGLVRKVISIDYDSVDQILGVAPMPRPRPFESGNTTDIGIARTSLSPSHREDLERLNKISMLMRHRSTSQAYNYVIPRAVLSLSQKPLHGASFDHPKPLQYRGFPQLTYEVLSQQHVEYGSRLMVAEFMKFACRVASRWFSARGVPMLRRSSKAPIALHDLALEELEASRDVDGYVDQYISLRSDVYTPPVEYTLTPGMHWNMGVPEGEGYVRVTSPLRRYGDLVAHWQIKHALLNESSPPLFSPEWLTSYGKELRQIEGHTKRAAQDHQKQWALMYIKRWMENGKSRSDLPDPLNCLVGRITGSLKIDKFNREARWTCYLPSIGLQGTLICDDPVHPNLPIGTEVDVKIDSIRLGIVPMLILQQK
ncbi:mitochondrial exoribonuclease [Serpula lacrymans var. lacrymans S7.9]|uniref:Mitochondrial exoribonuclease n=1 Tax=Serpula lacrymans var. lacrymans (strain S7.9) TaxID=578457 RepID=F8NWW0_SERL9|nr:mitochondrial exoribonuclease [Serpula lacrymans var. lacrymans S7.9]EGO25085.1 mitochondrial exoribonuclease [Serpula lacrymans var. lacrymans S7.9]